MIDLSNSKCWRCGSDVQCKAPILCPECHKKEVEKVHKYEEPEFPKVEDLVKYVPPPERLHRPTSSGRRVIRDSKTMS